jgi:hypothetical protein
MFDFFERFKRLNEKELTDLEESAGIEVFDKYGFFNTVYALANGDVLKFDQILETPAETIFMTLMFEKDKRKFEKNLKNIYQQHHDLSKHH